jgi:hypothetical protein
LFFHFARIRTYYLAWQFNRPEVRGSEWRDQSAAVRDSGGAGLIADANADSLASAAASKPRRRAIHVFIATLCFLLLTHGGHFYSIDNYTVYETARALSTGSLAIGPGLASARGRGGKYYGVYGIGLSLLEEPFICAGSLADRIFPGAFNAIVGRNVSIFYPENFSVFAATLLGPFCGALAATEFWLIAELLDYPRRVDAWLTILLVAATQFWPAARDSFPHIVVACLLLMTVRRALAWRDGRSTASPLILGCIAAVLILVRPFDAALTLPMVSIYLLGQDWPLVWSARRNSNFARFLIPVAVSIALFGLYNDLRFGSPTVFNESTGFGTPFRIGLYGLLLSVRRGIIFFSPPVVATVPGLIMLTRRRFGEGLLFAALIAVFPLGYACYSDWHGDLCWGPRFLVPVLPFAILPLGELLLLGGVTEALVLTLGLAGLMVQMIGTLVDFQRAYVPALFSDPNYSQIVGQLHDLCAGKYLDWMPLRLYIAHGFLVAATYAVPLVALAIWAASGLAKQSPSRPTAPIPAPLRPPPA